MLVHLDFHTEAFVWRVNPKAVCNSKLGFRFVSMSGRLACRSSVGFQ